RGGRSSVAGTPNWCRLRIAGRRIAMRIGRFRSRGRTGSQNCSDGAAAARDGAAAAVEPWVRPLQPLCPHDLPGVGDHVRLLAGGRGVVAEVRAVTDSEIVFEWDATDPEWVTVNGTPIPIGHLDTW